MSELARTAISGGAARGAVAAMAMSGMRTVTKGLGLVDQAPPERIARHGLPDLLARVPAEHRDEAIELAHWAYGAAAGAAFGALPAELRSRRWTGPAYGIAIWLVFEAGVVPLAFGLRYARRRRLVERAAIAADHVLYGAVLSAAPRR